LDRANPLVVGLAKLATRAKDYGEAVGEAVALNLEGVKYLGKI